MVTQNQRENILKKAYEIWEAEGRPNGRDMEHWLKAELEISSKGKAKGKPAAKTKAKAKAKKKPAAKKKSAPKKKAAAKRKT